ncbi:MAG: RNA polymerase sigma-70 factor [Saonia sp.]
MDFENPSLLIDALRKGDEKAYMFLLDKYHTRLHAYALTLVDDQALAQDIVQNVFVRTWQFRKKLNSKFSLQSFLYKSVYNEFINTYKKNKAVTLLEQKYLEALSETVEEIDEKRIHKVIALVSSEIKKLPPKCQKVFVLSKREGLTNKEISEHLNISVKTVEAQITKAFSILRSRLGDKFETMFFLVLKKVLPKKIS